MTDVLGVLESWDDDALTVRREDGSVVRIDAPTLVSGKAVPPRASVRHRVPAEEAARRALGSWPAVEAEPLGAWVLRASGGFSARANSVFLTGDPGMPWADAVAAARDFYDARGLPAWAQVDRRLARGPARLRRRLGPRPPRGGRLAAAGRLGRPSRPPGA